MTRRQNIVIIVAIGIIIGILTAIAAHPWVPVVCASWAIWGVSLGIAITRDR
ncbi:hypothetical protein GZ998_09100 [Actinomyces sp. 594]|uniref:hypothetical protein n=1 Tax=Actinomyces sp. 594 TaxID=2057793 RepID=UPI001C57671B|nr:hypothetical protein [Actinomyces sp. 594]MBW3069657.1 hypothetical protein [Actinomyces sp. 594]